MTRRWLDLIRSEYLDGYITEGGSAVKFVISSERNARADLSTALRTAAVSNGLLPMQLAAQSTKLHFIQLLFHEVAKQIDWNTLACNYLTSCLRRLDIAPGSQFPLDLDLLARGSGRTRSALGDQLQSVLRSDLVEDAAMSREFKTAFLTLCLGQLRQANAPLSPHALVVVRWFRGELVSLPELRIAGIFQRVARHNARYLLTSLARMIRKCGYRGTFLSLDICRYLESNRFTARISGYYYTPAAAVDLYEMLRQLIDEQGVLEGVFTVVWAPPEFVSDQSRGLDRYQALKMRIIDDVRARSHPNLLAPLVRL